MSIIYFSRSSVTTKVNQTQVESLHKTLSEASGYNPEFQSNPQNSLRPNSTTETYKHSTRVAIVNLPAPFKSRSSTTKNITYHFITNPPKRTTTQTPITTKRYDAPKSANVVEDFRNENIHPTTYSPPRNYVKRVTVKPISLLSFIGNNTNLKSIRKLINPIDINNVLSTLSNDNTREGSIEITTRLPSTTTKPTVAVTRSLIAEINSELKSENDFYQTPPKRTFQATVERAPVHELLDFEDLPKPEPDLPPSYKVKPNPYPSKSNSSYPSRASRVNSAIKSLIAVGGSRRHNTKCADTQTPDVKCDDLKQRYLFLLKR